MNTRIGINIPLSIVAMDFLYNKYVYAHATFND
jgi:hypothetical protein